MFFAFAEHARPHRVQSSTRTRRRRPRGHLPADFDHRAIGGGGDLLRRRLAAVPGVLGPQRVAHEFPHGFVGGPRGAHGVAQRPLVLAEQAHLEVAVGGEPQPVARPAEGGRHARDEADAAAEPRQAEELRRLAAGLVHELQPVVLLDAVHHSHEGHHLPPLPLVVVEGHVLDEPHLERPVARELREGAELVVVDAVHDDAVDLDRVVPERLGHADRVEHLAEPVPPRDEHVTVGIQRVERHVERRDARPTQALNVSRQQDGVGGDAEVLDPGQRREMLADLNDVFAHERLAAGESDLRHAHVGEGGGEAEDLVGGQQARARRQVDPLLGHAVHAAQVAALGEGDAQVVVLAAERVEQRRRRPLRRWALA
mmetsp:Transcript_23120/g.71719  ORF Transcript_23120/g.71719 Transcript_23120/m.71719 type:complete len:370 (-) Transcript_23120:90-1199(-)